MTHEEFEQIARELYRIADSLDGLPVDSAPLNSPLSAEDREQLRQLYWLALRFARRRRDDAIELLQDALFAAVRQGSQKLAEIRNVKAWFTEVLRRKAIDRFREKKRHSVRNFAETDVDVPSMEFSETEARRNATEYLERVARRAPEHLQTYLAAYVRDDGDHKTIAKRLGITEGASRARFCRLRDWIQDNRERLENDERPPPDGKDELYFALHVTVPVKAFIVEPENRSKLKSGKVASMKEYLCEQYGYLIFRSSIVVVYSPARAFGTGTVQMEVIEVLRTEMDASKGVVDEVGSWDRVVRDQLRANDSRPNFVAKGRGLELEDRSPRTLARQPRTMLDSSIIRNKGRVGRIAANPLATVSAC